MWTRYGTIDEVIQVESIEVPGLRSFVERTTRMIAYIPLIPGIFATDNASMRRPASEGAVPFQGAHGEEKLGSDVFNNT